MRATIAAAVVIGRTVIDARAALRHPAFVRLQSARFLAVIGLQMVSVALGWQVYELTGRALDLGLLGLVQFVPVLLLFPVTGWVADRYDRKWVAVACYGGLGVGTAALAIGGWFGLPLAALYGLVFCLACARAFTGPVSAALLAQTVPQDAFANAVTWSSTAWSLAATAGPALGGAVYAVFGSATGVYATATGCLGVAFALLLGMRPRPAARSAGGRGWGHVFAGIRYIARRQVLYGAIGLDLFAVLFGGAVALLPIYARDILDVGPLGLGVLRAAPAIGSVTMASFLSFHPIERRAGHKLLAAVAVFGLATLGFAFSRSFDVALVSLIVTGAADQVSVVVRKNLSQLATPEELRGRVSAAEFVFIGVSNEIGEFESGIAAELGGPVFAAASGGFASLAVVGLAAWLVPELRRVDALTAEALSTPDDGG